MITFCYWQNDLNWFASSHFLSTPSFYYTKMDCREQNDAILLEEILAHAPIHTTQDLVNADRCYINYRCVKQNATALVLSYFWIHKISFVMLCAIWHHLYNSKNAITFSKVAVQFFLNCTNGTKSSNTSHLNSLLSKFKSKQIKNSKLVVLK